MSERLMFELKKYKAKQIEQKMKYGKDYDD